MIGFGESQNSDGQQNAAEIAGTLPAVTHVP